MAQLLAAHYERHQPERTLLYQVVQKHYPIFRTQLEDEGRPLPGYVQREFDDFLRCGILEHGFLRVRCDHCHFERLIAFSCKRRGFCPSCGVRRMVEASALLVDAVLPEQPIRQWVLSVPYPLRFLFASQPKVMGKVLGIVYRTIARHLLKTAGYRTTKAQTGAVTLIQRFGSALNLNIHFHMLFLDGVYAEDRHGVSRFFRVKAPSHAELIALAHQLSHRVGRYLERQGLLSRDLENAYLAFDLDESNPMPHLQSSSIQYRIAMGSQQGRKAFQLQTVAAAHAENASSVSSFVAKVSGFSLHAGVCAQADERKKLEQLCRYITRPAISEKRLSLTGQGHVRIQLKTPYRDGTTHVVLEPLEFMAHFPVHHPSGDLWSCKSAILPICHC